MPLTIIERYTHSLCLRYALVSSSGSTAGCNSIVGCLMMIPSARSISLGFEDVRSYSQSGQLCYNMKAGRVGGKISLTLRIVLINMRYSSCPGGITSDRYKYPSSYISLYPKKR
jgi:hypothetical protein